MFEFLPHPDIKPTNLADQTKQTNEYLFRLKESLEFMLTTIDVENLSPEFRARLEAIGVDINTNGISEDMIAQMASNAITIEDVLDSYLMDERFKEELKDVLTQEDIDELSALLKAHTDSKSNPHGVTKAQVGLGNVNNTSDADKPVSTAQQEAIDGVSASVTAHTGNKSNPHGVTKAQLGLGNVNNTSDASKPVSTAQQSAIDSAYANATAYTDQKVADLINGAPSTLDTLKEIADAMAGNADVVEALEESIGTKANQSELDSHTGNTTVHVTASEKSSWNKAYLENHTHSNKSVLDGITSALVTAWNSAVTHISDTVKHITATERSNWNSAYNTMHTHSNKSVLDGTTASFTTAEKTKLSGIASGANAYTHPSYNAYSGFPKDTVTTSFGYPLTISVVDTDETGHVTAMNHRTVVMPSDEATQTSKGLMSADDKKKLDGIVEGANAYTHPSYTARTGVPTANQTPAFGGSFSVSQPVSDASGHVTAVNSRTVTIPSTLSNGTGTTGLIKTTSTVTSNSGYTACPVINGVPYYKEGSGGTVSGDYLPLAGGTLTGNTYFNALAVLANNKALCAKNTSGSAQFMAYIGTNNRMYLGTGVCDRLYIGDNSNTARMQIFSKGRIDFVPLGVSSTDYPAISITEFSDADNDVPCLRGTSTSTLPILGNGKYPWATVYQNVASYITSDRKFKDNIQNLDERYIQLWEGLQPRSYYVKGEKEQRIHLGFIAQEVEEAMEKVGLTYEECAFLHKEWVERDGYTGYEYLLTYDDLAVLTTAKVKQQEERIATLEKEVAELKALINK